MSVVHTNLSYSTTLNTARSNTALQHHEKRLLPKLGVSPGTTNPGSKGGSQPQRSPNRIGMSRSLAGFNQGVTYKSPKSLAAVRLVPINSKPMAPSAENPLDKHKRADVLLVGSSGVAEGNPPDSNGTNTIKSHDPMHNRVIQLADEDQSVKHDACNAILEDLSKYVDHRKSKEYIKYGLLHNIKNCLRLQDSPGIQLVSLKIVSCLVSGPAHFTDSVVSEGCAPYLLPLVSSPHPSISEEAVWALGNMAGDSCEVRELVLRTGIMPILLKVIASERWATTRDEVTAIFAQKLNSASSSSRSSELRRSTPPPPQSAGDMMAKLAGGARWKRSFSFPTTSTPQKPRDVEVRQNLNGGTVMNLIVPSIEMPRTAGPHSRNRKEDKC